MEKVVEIKKQILGQILTSEVRARLANLKLTKPQLVEQIEIQLIQSTNSGSLKSKVIHIHMDDLPIHHSCLYKQNSRRIV